MLLNIDKRVEIEGDVVGMVWCRKFLMAGNYSFVTSFKNALFV